MKVVGLVLAFGLLGWESASAQCADGSPPPCPIPASPVALDDRTWLILPFENTARSADAELIRPAALNLLYQELAAWSDVRVVSDDRVDDLLNALPEAQRSPLGLEAARTLARRVGAGKVVLGDYLAVGPQAQIVAKVYDVRSGRQIRLVRERLLGFSGVNALDSMSATFSRLGASILGLSPRQGTPSIAGTTSIEAFRVYLQGKAAMNVVDVETARRHLQRAIDIDSAFAPAQYALYQVMSWPGSPDSVAGLRHLLAAERLSSRLAPLERAKMTLARAIDSSAAAACGPAARVLALDSLEPLGWVGSTRCALRLLPLRPFPGDTNRRLLAGDLNQARRAALRATEVDPTFLFSHVARLQSVSLTSAGPLCEREAGGPCPPDSLWVGAVIPSGDTALFPLERWSGARADPPWHRAQAVNYRRAQFAQMVRAMEAWGAQSRRNIAALTILATARTELGDMAAAAGLLDSVYGPVVPPPTRQLKLITKLALERPGIAAAVDSFYGLAPGGAGAQGSLWGMVGRYREDGIRGPVNSRTVREAWLPVTAGVLPANFDSIETALADVGGNAINRRSRLEASTLFAFRMRGTGPALDTAGVHPIHRFQAFLARRDTARARAALAVFDTVLGRRAPGTRDDGGWLFAAESFLALGDSARALALMLDWRRRWTNTTKLLTTDRILDLNAYQSVPRIWGRAWLLLADLAMARGQPAEARRAYQMVVNLWETGDAPVQPLVARARAAIATIDRRRAEFP